ncbi:CocE/NonD family hydrolase [Novosphingobium flavum]|uniref:CocE/NonD family hydrolase n=1 Tax=Novosphingobium flavum TaxID=1778672 RepID=A0A7X1FNG9_9SPHN|nr:CocE/NonD family hydrolase [Novosphingobium flavum]
MNELPLSRRALLASGTGMAALGLSGGAGQAEAAPVWQLPEARPVEVTEVLWIAMPDGVKLAARLWLPEGARQKPVGVVLEYIPYRLWDLRRAQDDSVAATLAPYGIAYIRVDIRGSGNSEGTKDDEYSVEELNDAVSVIEWLSRQPWCNGNVGMRGISWGGINSLQVAAMAPPALKAIVPMGCCDNRYTGDAHFLGGSLGEQQLAWGTTFKGELTEPPDPQVVGDRWEELWLKRLEATPAIVRTWTEHQRYDDYWKRGSIAVDYAAIRCAVYVVNGWGDPYSDVIGRLLEKLSVPRKGLIGPWGHIFPQLATPQGLDWKYEEARWWHHWLMGARTGIMAEPMLRTFSMYESDPQAFPAEVPGTWIAEDKWPSSRIRTRTLHLNDGGALSPAKGADKPVRYVGDRIVGTTKAQWIYGRPTELEQSADDAKSLVFTSAPLPDNLEILGYPTARLRIAADKPIAQCCVRLTEVTPDGKSWLISYKLLNLTRRDSIEHPTPLVPGQFYDVDFPMYFIGHRFAKGSRVRVAISAGLWPLAWPTPEIATLDIVQGASRIDLPVRLTPGQEAPFAVPGTHPGQKAAPTVRSGEKWGPGKRVAYESFGLAEPRTVELATGASRKAGADRVIEMIEGQPLTNRIFADRVIGYKRGEWDCTIRYGSEMTCTAEAFHLREWVIAFKGDKEIFRRETPSIIPRDLM